jgi:CubicO group peptidase (beta-lactamase class C family)
MGRAESECFDEACLYAAWQLVLTGVRQGAFGGAVALVAHRGVVVLHRAAGWACREPQPVPMTAEVIFDLASLTKVVATLPSVLCLVARGELELDRPVGQVLPEFGHDGWKTAVTIRRLLSHTSGLPAWLPLYLDARGPDEYVAAIARLEPAAPPGQQAIYSDLNFILLGEVVKRISGQDVAGFAASEIFTPLGMRDTLFRPPPALRLRIAATERGNGSEMGQAGERAASFPYWRHELIWGEVHDGNAFYGLGGVAGHAGLFSTATDLARYGQMWLQRGSWRGTQVLPARLLAEATRPQAPGRGLGWLLAGPEPRPETFPARGLSPSAYGHTGFTGTSLWIDPELELVVILLTNRVHPEVRDEIATIRPAFHERVAAAFRRPRDG